MKHDVQEIAAVESALKNVESEITRLDELNLVLAGGGVGEVVIA
ncbi:MAG TPA: hypothetical protein VEC19_17380 [Usitatibacter sp.]|nr:hypothetical protein [Usitatibacter sp.]